MHVELQLHDGNVEEVLHVVVAVFLWTDVKVIGEQGHCDDIIRDVVRKASIHHSLEKECVKCIKCEHSHMGHTEYTHTHTQWSDYLQLSKNIHCYHIRQQLWPLDTPPVPPTHTQLHNALVLSQQTVGPDQVAPAVYTTCRREQGVGIVRSGDCKEWGLQGVGTARSGDCKEWGLQGVGTARSGDCKEWGLQGVGTVRSGDCKEWGL